MSSEKMVNYTPEQTASVLQMWQEGNTADQIASAINRTVRSVIAKLSREGVYKRATDEAKVKRTTKAELVAKVAEKLGATEAELAELKSLEKGSHKALEILAAGL